MGFGAVVLAVFLAAAALLGIFVIAGAQQPFTDSYGNTTSESTNATIGLVQNTTAPIAEVGGGMVLFLGVIALLVVALVIYGAVKMNDRSYGRRG